MEFVNKYKVIGYDNYHQKISQVILPEQPDETMLKSIVSTCKVDIAYFEITQIMQVVENEIEKHDFTDDELSILRNIDKEFQYIARDDDDSIGVYSIKPIHKKCNDEFYWECLDGKYRCLSCFEHLFKDIKCRDREPVRIDDYVDRS